MLAGLGGLWSERAGIVNIGLEGMLILGTYGAGYFGYHSGPWAGVAGAVLMGMLGGLIHAIATVVFGVDHIISGVAINIIALGAVQYLASLTFAGLPGGGSTQSPKIGDVQTLTIEPLSDALLDVEKKDWFFVSELAAFGRALVDNLSFLVISSMLLLVVTYWVLWRTSFGLRLRACGESPAAAESLGVKVLRYKFVAVLISGGLAGLGGGCAGDGGREQLPRRPDRRSRLHRPGGDDLRQLATRGAAGRLRTVRLHRDAGSAAGRRVGARTAAGGRGAGGRRPRSSGPPRWARLGGGHGRHRRAPRRDLLPGRRGAGRLHRG